MSDTWMLVHSPARIVSEYLISDLGLVSRPSDDRPWPMFVGHVPDGTEDEMCSVFDTTPIDEGRAMKTGERFQHYGIQLGVRSGGYEIGWAKCEVLSNALSEVHNDTVIISSDLYMLGNIMKLNSGFIGLNENRKSVFVSNFILTIKKVS